LVGSAPQDVGGRAKLGHDTSNISSAMTPTTSAWP
jgi:hypothetical protein